MVTRRLRLGRRAVDFVGQDDIGEHRPLVKDELAPSRLRILLDQVGAGNVRWHQVRGELNA